MLPLIFHHSQGFLLVVGGGAVGRRKAAAACAAGFPVRIVDPNRAEWPGAIWIAEPYHSTHLDGASLVVAAATTAVNAEVVADARRARVPVCDAADPSAGDFTFPATVRSGPLLLAVSTGGASPTLAARIRDELATRFDESYGEWVRLLGEVRGLVLQTVPDAPRRQQFLAGLAAPDWLTRLREVGPESVRTEMLAALEAVRSSV